MIQLLIDIIPFILFDFDEMEKIIIFHFGFSFHQNCIKYSDEYESIIVSLIVVSDVVL